MLRKVLSVCLCACMLVFSGACKKEKADITVYMPDGAPAIALAGAMHADTADDGVCYKVVKADTIASFVSYEKESDNADICIMPVSSASKLLGNGEKYRLAATLTHGNLYLISKNGETQYTLDNVSALLGKTVGVLQINAVPGLTFKATLEKQGVAYAEMKNADEKKTDAVNLKAITDITAEDGTLDAYLVAEPAASVQVNKNGYTFVGDLQSLYGGEKGYPQAVAVVKNSCLEKDSARAKTVLEKIENSCAWVQTASGADIVAAVNAHMADSSQTTSLKAPLLHAEVIARCKIRFEKAKDAKTEIDAFLSGLGAVNENAVGRALDAFFWDWE